MRLLRFCLALVLWPGIASAALEFESNRIDLKPAVGTKIIDAVFKFKNSGTTAVNVLEVRSSCGCAVPELAKRNYSPGETGQLNVHFTIGDRQGLQDKTITLRTDVGDHTVQLVVDLPQRLVINPRLVVYRGDDLAERTLTLTFRADAPVSQVSLSNVAPPFAVALATVHAGADYTVTVKLSSKPLSDQRATVMVHSKGASGLDYTDAFFLSYVP